MAATTGEIPRRQQFLISVDERVLPNTEGGISATSLLATYARGLLKLHDVAEFYSMNDHQPFTWKEPQGMDRKQAEIPVTDKTIAIMARGMQGLKEDLVTKNLVSHVENVEKGVEDVLEHEGKVHGRTDDEFVTTTMTMAKEPTPTTRFMQAKTAFMDQMQKFTMDLALTDSEAAGMFAEFTEHIIITSDYERGHGGKNSPYLKHARAREFELWQKLKELGYAKHASAIVEKLKNIYDPKSVSVQT